MRIFSSLVMEAPGLCSPSRKVVSNMINLLVILSGSVAIALRGDHLDAACFETMGEGNLAREAQLQRRQQAEGGVQLRDVA
jgi:hypothetical protein